MGYVKQLLSSGYPLPSVKAELMKQGLNSQQADDAIREATTHHVHHTIHFSPAVIGVIFAILIGSIGFGYFILDQNAPKNPAQLLDLNLEPVTTTIKAGEDIVFLKEVTSMGSQERFDVVLTTELISRQGKVVTSKVETRGIETIGSTQTRLEAPSTTQPGEYVLRTIATYDGKKAIATIPVTVQASEGCNDNVKNNGEMGIDCGGPCPPCTVVEDPKTVEDCNDFNPCTRDRLIGGKCLNSDITPCCGNGACEGGEQTSCSRDCPLQNEGVSTPGIKQSQDIDDIKLLATTDPQQAARECAKQTILDYQDSCSAHVAAISQDSRYCEAILNENIKDVCFSEVAKARGTPSLCLNIANKDKQDSCHIIFITEFKDYSVCENVHNRNLRQSCYALKQLSES